MSEETISQQLVKRATKAGKMPIPRLQLCNRVEKKVNGEVELNDDGKPKMVVVGTGPHTVMLISEKYAKGTDYITKQERTEVEYIFEEKGQKKRYNVPVKDKNDELHYFVQRMSELAHGEVVILEYKKNGMTGFIDVKRTVNQEVGIKNTGEIPIIEEDEDPKPKQEPKKVVPVAGGSDKEAEEFFNGKVPGEDVGEINVDEIPF